MEDKEEFLKELIEDIYGKDYYDLDVSEPDYDLTL